jgi:predicted nuclease of predicted toxin-antitoxin system
MRILLDTCVWGGVKAELEHAGHDVVWCGDWDEDPGDEEILHTAYREERICVTLDKDFGELAVVYGLPHHGIIRLVNLASWQQSGICLQVLAKYGNDLLRGAIVTAEADRLRYRPPESQ